jgi:hypothetical protein
MAQLPTLPRKRTAEPGVARRKSPQHRGFHLALQRRLMEESAKAGDNGPAYVPKTATRAAEGSAQRR